MTSARRACTCIAVAFAAASAVAPRPVPAQSVPRGGLSATVQFARIGIMDANASPLRYLGGELGGALGYRHAGSRWHVAIEAAITAPELRSRVSDDKRHTESALSATLRAALQRVVLGGATDRYRVHLGAQLLGIGLGRTHEYDLGATENFADLFLPLQLTAGWEYRIRDNILSETLAVPIIALVARTPYQGLKDVPRFQLESGADARAFEHVLRLEHPLSKNWSSRFEIIILYIAHDEPRTLRMEDHRAAFSLQYRRTRRLP